MILVQNHLRLLNGSSKYLMILLFSFLVIACSSSKKSTKRSSTRTSTSKKTSKKRSNTKVETVEWKDVTPQKKRVEDSGPIGERKETYNVNIFLPLNSAKATDSNILEEGYNENRFANYYAGIKLALAELENSNVNLNIEVLDTETGNFTSKLENSKNADLIIGPYDRDKLKFAADWCKRKKIPLISPWQSSSKIPNMNPYYVQLRPNIKSYMKAIVDHVSKNFSDEQVILIGRDKGQEKSMNDYMQRYAMALNNSKEKVFKEYQLSEDSLVNGETAFDSVFMMDKPAVFILPNYSFQKDESYIYSCVRKLSSEIGYNKVYLYGMPILLDSDKIEFDHYKNLNMRVCRSKYVDRNKHETKMFRQLFYNTYFALPTDDALEGYDMMNFIGKSIAKYGTDFQLKLDSQVSRQLQTAFDIQAIYSEGDDFKNIEYLENQSLDIIGFENNTFSRLR